MSETNEASPASETSDVKRLVMRNGDVVKVLLAGDSYWWHTGVVINAKKQWVEFIEGDGMYPFIADESNILRWELANDA